jgi:hypothetical protein
VNESAWLIGNDPHAMVRHLAGLSDWRSGDRLFALFAVACCHESGILNLGRDAEWCLGYSSGPATNPVNWATAWAGDQKRPTEARRVQIVRDVFGNPWRPWWIETDRYDGDRMIARDPWGRTELTESLKSMDPPRSVFELKWLTPDVRALARSAYDRLAKRKCPVCQGRGFLTVHHGTSLNPGWRNVACQHCEGKRLTEDGSLDEQCLDALSDALEEAGCHGRVCHWCGGEGCRYEGSDGWRRPGPHWNGCRSGIEPHPVVAHLRSEGKKYRGMWSLDLLIDEGRVR